MAVQPSPHYAPSSLRPLDQKLLFGFVSQLPFTSTAEVAQKDGASFLTSQEEFIEGSCMNHFNKSLRS